MTRWLMIAPMTLLAACAKGGGGNGEINTPLCSAQATANQVQPTASVSSAQDKSDINDPYQRFGKVLLASAKSRNSPSSSNQLTPDGVESLKDPVHAPYMGGDAKIESTLALQAGTELTVTLKDACNQGEISGAVRAKETAEGTAPTRSGVRAYSWTLSRDLTRSELNQIVERDVCVTGVSETSIARVHALPNDQFVNSQAHLPMLEAGSAYDLLKNTRVTKPIVIAVIDTGIEMNHPDLKSVLWTNNDEIPGNGIDDDQNGYVDDVNGYNFADRVSSPQYAGDWEMREHGTHVAGLIAAQGGNGIGVTGVMPSGARLMVLNVFGSEPGAKSTAIANAIRYAADNGADIINMSLGSPGRNAAYESAIVYALQKKVPVFTAAGNDGMLLDSENFISPGSYGTEYPGVVNIGSVDANTGAFSRFSNYSPVFVELAAPGAESSSPSFVGLLSTWGNGNYARQAGTSMSAPIVSGAAAIAIAMLRERGFSPSPATLEGILHASSRQVPRNNSSVQEGRSLNLKMLAEFIQNNYSQTGDGTTDPGVPSSKACVSSVQP